MPKPIVADVGSVTLESQNSTAVTCEGASGDRSHGRSIRKQSRPRSRHRLQKPLCRPARRSVPPPPSQLSHQMRALRCWAESNRLLARSDLVKFWALKLPAILVSATAAVLAHLGLNDTSVVAGAMAAACGLIDGLNPRGAQRSCHLRAQNEINSLVVSMASQWRIGALRGEDANTLAAFIIDQSECERKRISAYLNTAETSLVDRAVEIKAAS
jgi:hypothetical protein